MKSTNISLILSPLLLSFLCLCVYAQTQTFLPSLATPSHPTTPQKLDLTKFPVRMEGLMRPMGNVNRPNDLPVWHHRSTPTHNNHPPPFASPESDEGAGYSSPADALPFDQVRRVIGSSFRTGSSGGGGGPQSGIYSQPHDHLPRGTVSWLSLAPLSLSVHRFQKRESEHVLYYSRHCVFVVSFYLCYASAPTKGGAGVIMFLGCPSVHPSVRTSVPLSR